MFYAFNYRGMEVLINDGAYDSSELLRKTIAFLIYGR
jgi:hypothetical protein